MMTSQNKPVQPPLFPDMQPQPPSLLYEVFSHHDVCDENERLALEQKYQTLFTVDDRFNRKIVSFQANKDEIVHSWLKYREGFSSTLVEILLKEFRLKAGDTVLDPFAGSATTLLVSKTTGVNAVGIEILPNCHLAWEAKSKFAEYDLDELRTVFALIQNSHPLGTDRAFPHIPITQSAFPHATENEIMWYTEWFDQLPINDNTKILCKLIITSILEDVSFTRKDGQFLRWDQRSDKLSSRNISRVSKGKKALIGINKGELPGVKQSLLKVFKDIIVEIELLQSAYTGSNTQQKIIQGNTLEILPTLANASFSAVITSPPYANRYDYTRTYALELAYLGVGASINALRQNLLSCTVESKSKVAKLAAYYQAIGELERYQGIVSVIKENQGLKEVNSALETRWKRGDMNNKGVLPMINQYFSELGFVFAELFRVCRTGAQVAFVNDDVRYGGEIIPVNTITTNLAEAFGFEPVKIIVLAQKKGNSSQQMDKFGRAELRKCITIWRKP